MQTARYFETDEQLKAKNWDMLQDAVMLKRRKVGLENELKQFAVSWSELGRNCSGSPSWTYEVGDQVLRLLNPSQSHQEIGKVPWRHLDGEAIRRLFSDLQQTGDTLNDLERQLKELGIQSF